MSVTFFDPVKALAEIESKSVSLATFATFATSQSNQQVTHKNIIATNCDKLRQAEKSRQEIKICRNLSHNVATGATNKNIYNNNEICENVADVANVATLTSEHILFTYHTGKALHCIYCLHWHGVEASVWWSGTCGLHGHNVSNKSRCAIVGQ